MKKISFVASTLALALTASGCLKTRAQLRDEGSDDRDGPGRPVPAQVQDVQPQGQYVIDEIKGEMTRLTGRIEDLERQNQQLAAQPKNSATTEEIKRLETRIVELEQAQVAMLEAIKKMQASAPAVESVDTFQKGKTQLQAGDYDAAIESFTSYLRAPNAKFAEDATFMRGEAHFELKQYKKAIVDYSKFPEKYHRSARMPQALYKIGVSFEALGMKEDAKGFYQELVEKFPKSAEAKKVRAKLK